MRTLADLLARFDLVEDQEDGWLVRCPVHHGGREAHPSLRLSVSEAGKVLVKCRTGCPTEEVMAALGLTMGDLGRMVPGDVPDRARATSTDAPASPADVAALAVRLEGFARVFAGMTDRDAEEPGDREEDALAYAVRRFGLSVADVQRLGLGYAGPAVYAEDGSLVRGLPGGPRLVVPFRDRQGVARGFQARALAPDASVRWLGPPNPDGASWARAGFFQGGAGLEPVLVTEGPGDGLTAVAAGFDAVAVRGAGLTHNEAIVDEIATLLGDREAVVAGDGDAAGRRFSSTLAEGLVARGKRVRLLAVPDGEDLTSWREKAPERFAFALYEAVAAAEPVTDRRAALLAWDESRYSLTDLGGARYLRDYVESVGSGVRYSEEVGFFLLEDGVWRRDERQGIRTHAQAVADLVRGLAAEAAEIATRDGASREDRARAGRLVGYAKHAQTTRGLDAMLRELQAVRGVPASVDAFDRHPDLLAVRNGVVNLRTGELLPHDPALLLTRRVDVDYSPDARAPRWERFLEEVFPAYPALPAYIRRLIGYGITGHTAEQCFAVLWGTGANGKSVFTDTLTEVFREHTVTTPFSTFEERASGGIPNDLAALKGARLVMAAEGDQGRPMAEAVLKRVTGRDLISARFMRKEFFEFRPTFLLLLATNFRPSFRGQDEGLWRRVKLIPWERYFRPEERDHRLGERLLEEAPGILAWAVRGAGEWYREGLSDPAVIRDSTREYRETSDALAGFFPGVYVEDPEAGRVEGGRLFSDYLAWAEEENLPARERWTRRTFFSAMEERGLGKRKTSKGVAFDGIRRARQTDAAAPEPVGPGRAETPGQAHSSTDRPIRGADLDSAL